MKKEQMLLLIELLTDIDIDISCLDIPVTRLRRLGVVQNGAGIVMAASSGDCARFKM